MKTIQNRGTDAYGCTSIQFYGPGEKSKPVTIKAPAPHTSTEQQQAYLEGFAAAVKLIDRTNDGKA